MVEHAGNSRDPLARITWMFVLLALAGGCQRSSCEVGGEGPANVAPPPCLAQYAVSGCTLAVVFNPARLSEMAETRPELTELIRAGGERLGYDPAQLRCLSGLFALGEDASLTFAAAVYASRTPIDGSRLLRGEFGAGAVSEGRIQGKQCYWLTAREPGHRLVVCVPEERLALLSLESGIRKMLNGPDPKSELAVLLRRFPDDHDLVVAAVLPPLRPAIRRLRMAADAKMPQVAPYFMLAELAETAVFRANFVGDATTELVMEAKDSPSAEELEQLVRSGSDALRKLAEAILTEQFQGKPELVAPAADGLLGKFEISRNKAQVTARCRAGEWLMHMLTTFGLMIGPQSRPAE